VSPFDDGTTIVTERLSLVPLRVEDAEEMAGVLGDQRLHEFIGGEPDTIAGLRERYARLVAGSPDPDELWLNWVVRRRSDAQPMGTLQATLTMRNGESTANVAWVIGVDWQNQGFASEAARALVGWLRQHGADNVVAHIHPDHQASAAVAMRAGLRLTDSKQTANGCGERPTVVLDPWSCRDARRGLERRWLVRQEARLASRASVCGRRW
jgi:RimJ/RimL family protein N-acetyltransferase